MIAARKVTAPWIDETPQASNQLSPVFNIELVAFLGQLPIVPQSSYGAYGAYGFWGTITVRTVPTLRGFYVET